MIDEEIEVPECFLRKVHELSEFLSCQTPSLLIVTEVGGQNCVPHPAFSGQYAFAPTSFKMVAYSLREFGVCVMYVLSLSARICWRWYLNRSFHVLYSSVGATMLGGVA